MEEKERENDGGRKRRRGQWVVKVSESQRSHFLFSADTILRYMSALNVPLGLSKFGYTTADIPDLVEGTLPQVVYFLFLCFPIQLFLQKRVTQLSPTPTDRELLTSLFEGSMSY
jgi:hypothetical protein